MAHLRLPRVALAICLLAATACSKDEASTPTIDIGAKPVESGLADAGKPQRGGQLVYAMEADNLNYCLPEAQMAMAGMQVTRAIYDPLVVPNAEGGYSPYLAQSVEPNPDFTEWTIRLRDGVTLPTGRSSTPSWCVTTSTPTEAPPPTATTTSRIHGPLF